MCVCVSVMALISINSMVIKALIGRHECRSGCQFGRGSSGKRAINQSVNQTNQSMHYFAIVKHASIQNAHVACCTLHVARCFYEFFDAAAAAISSKFATGSVEREGVDEELDGSWKGRGSRL